MTQLVHGHGVHGQVAPIATPTAQLLGRATCYLAGAGALAAASYLFAVGNPPLGTVSLGLGAAAVVALVLLTWGLPARERLLPASVHLYCLGVPALLVGARAHEPIDVPFAAITVAGLVTWAVGMFLVPRRSRRRFGDA